MQSKVTHQFSPNIANKTITNFKRPKRCYVCKKMINSEKYDSHFQQCCQNQKIQADKHRQMIKKSRPKPERVSIRQMIDKNPPVIKHQSINKNKDSHVNFRIKNHPSPMIGSTKENIKETTKRKINRSEMKQFSSKQTMLNPQKKQILPKNVSFQKQFERKKASFSMPHKKLNYGQKKETKPNQTQIEEKQSQPEFKEQKKQDQILIQQKPQPKIQKEQSIQLSSLSEQQQDPVAPNHTFRVIDVVEEPQPVIQESQPVNIQQNTFQNRDSTFSQMVRLTNEIIAFITRVGLHTDPTLAMMVEQLHHVNEISQQIQELNQVGNSLGFTMETLFGNRIQQLQQVIISQVSFAVLRSFSNSSSFQFQVLMERNPELRRGFTKKQIQEKFPVITSAKEGECSICLQQYQQSASVIKMQCAHQFHPDCIQKWLDTSKNCPLCRREQK